MKTYSLTCGTCGREFIRTRSDFGERVYCSRRCNIVNNNAQRVAQLARRNSTIRQPGSYKLLVLTKGKVAKVSNEDYAVLAKYPWGLCGNYARNRGVQLHVYIFTRLMKRQRSEVSLVDHANGDYLDCRRPNLRLADKQLNAANSKLWTNNKSGYRGVSWFKRDQRWHSRIMLNGREIHLGYYDDIVEAAYIYDQWALALYGEYARFNVIDA